MSASALACVRCGARPVSQVPAGPDPTGDPAPTFPLDWADHPSGKAASPRERPARRSALAEYEQEAQATFASRRPQPIPRRIWTMWGLLLVIEVWLLIGLVWQGELPRPQHWLDARLTTWIAAHVGLFAVTAFLAGLAALVLPAGKRASVWSPPALAFAAVTPFLAAPWMLAWLVDGLLTIGQRFSFPAAPPLAESAASPVSTGTVSPSRRSGLWTTLVLVQQLFALGLTAILLWPEPWREGLPPAVQSAMESIQQAGPLLAWSLAALGIGYILTAAGGVYWETFREGGLLTWLAPVVCLAPWLVFLSVAVLTGLGRDVLGPGAISASTALRDSVLLWGMLSLYGLYTVVISWAAMQRHLVIAAIGYVLSGPVLLTGWETARRESHRLDCARRLSVLAAGLNQYAGEYRELPPPVLRDAEGRPLLSWRVLLLPYLGETDLYHRFRLDEAWDSPHNRPLLESRPDLFACDELPWNDAVSTLFVAVVGEETLFPAEGGISASELAGRGEEVIVFVERHRESAVPWTAPDDAELARIDFDHFVSNHGPAPLGITVQGEAVTFRPPRGGDPPDQPPQRRFWRPSASNKRPPAVEN